MACDTTALLYAARCLNCMDDRSLNLLRVQLLCELVSSGVVGGSQVYTGSTPPAAPGDPNSAAIFYFESAAPGPMKNWSIVDQAWF